MGWNVQACSHEPQVQDASEQARSQRSNSVPANSMKLNTFALLSTIHHLTTRVNAILQSLWYTIHESIHPTLGYLVPPLDG
jgi:hypothetical protein